jgi:hypothetical protein
VSPQCRPSADRGEQEVAPVPVIITQSTVAKAIADARPGGRRYDIVDARSRGLSLRVSPTGVQWSFRYQINGVDRRVALGACPSNSRFFCWRGKRESDSVLSHEQDIPRLED